MERREAAALLVALAGGTMIGSPLLLSGCRKEVAPETLIFFTREEMQLLEQVADTILPATTASPGAAEAGIGSFMDIYTADCLDTEDQDILRGGLVLLNERCRERYTKNFLDLSPEERHQTLLDLDIESEKHQQQVPPSVSPHYFALVKGLTLLGYFTSEAGATKALRYVPVPGRYEGIIPYENGEKSWAI